MRIYFDIDSYGKGEKRKLFFIIVTQVLLLISSILVATLCHADFMCALGVALCGIIYYPMRCIKERLQLLDKNYLECGTKTILWRTGDKELTGLPFKAEIVITKIHKVEDIGSVWLVQAEWEMPVWRNNSAYQTGELCISKHYKNADKMLKKFMLINA